jgi:hypothetical protein
MTALMPSGVTRGEAAIQQLEVWMAGSSPAMTLSRFPE